MTEEIELIEGQEEQEEVSGLVDVLASLVKLRNEQELLVTLSVQYVENKLIWKLVNPTD